MKHLNLHKYILALALLGVVGCANDKRGNSPDAQQPPIVAPGVGGTTPGVNTPAGQVPNSDVVYGAGSTADFSPVSLEEFNSYVATHPLNYPSNFKLTVNLKDVSGGRYAGEVKISYNDSGKLFQGVFKAGDGVNPTIQNGYDNGVYESEFNRWFVSNGLPVFSGFFQDNYGSIVLVVENSIEQADGQGPGVLSGSVWYRNFAQVFAPQGPMRKCWFIYSGPYNCRANEVISKSSLFPSSMYRKLGTFTGLSKERAFNL